jgi:ketosteroid isomerase-like protein
MKGDNRKLSPFSFVPVRKGKIMKATMFLVLVVVVLMFTSVTKAGDKEDVHATLNSTIEAFNKRDYKTYFSYFVDDNAGLPYVVSPLRYDAAGWKDFIEETGKLEYVNYHQQDEQIQIYNGDIALVTGHYIVKCMEKSLELDTRSGRTSMVLVKHNSKWYTVQMHFSKMFK